jgi:hypothetical protein
MKRQIPDFSKKKSPSQHPQVPTAKNAARPPVKAVNVKPPATSSKSGRRGT